MMYDKIISLLISVWTSQEKDDFQMGRASLADEIADIIGYRVED